jgi:rhodanese-related sulfurtransferase
MKLNESIKTGLHQFKLLDIRNQTQFTIRHLPGAVNIPFEWIKESFTSISAISNIILIVEKNLDGTAKAIITQI